ncbi:putative membrane protein [Salmonella enterica subsp. enterica]|nr:putative membrane protein [Salmonella enterica subsp. enterica]
MVSLGQPSLPLPWHGFAMSATEVEGIGSVLHAYGFLYLALGVLMWFAMPRDNHNSASGEKKGQRKNICTRYFWLS